MLFGLRIELTTTPTPSGFITFYATVAGFIVLYLYSLILFTFCEVYIYFHTLE